MPRSGMRVAPSPLLVNLVYQGAVRPAVILTAQSLNPPCQIAVVRVQRHFQHNS